MPEFEPNSPQHEALRTEYGEALKSGSQAAIETVAKKYDAAFGNKQADLGGGGLHAGPAPIEDEQNATTEQQLLSQCDDECRQAWGPEYDANMELVERSASEMFAEAFPDPREAQQMASNVQAALLEGGVSLAGINRLLLAAARKRAS